MTHPELNETRKGGGELTRDGSQHLVTYTAVSMNFGTAVLFYGPINERVARERGINRSSEAVTFQSAN
jgi:hypothetical protein